jgi:hypothetical protein
MKSLSSTIFPFDRLPLSWCHIGRLRSQEISRSAGPPTPLKLSIVPSRAGFDARGLKKISIDRLAVMKLILSP